MTTPMKARRSKKKAAAPPATGVDDKALFLQPWYVPRDVYMAIRSLVPLVHINKMRFYFEDWGCLRCKAKNVLYGSNGFCEKCDTIIRGRLDHSLRRRLRSDAVVAEAVAKRNDTLDRRTGLARRLLRTVA